MARPRSEEGNWWQANSLYVNRNHVLKSSTYCLPQPLVAILEKNEDGSWAVKDHGAMPDNIVQWHHDSVDTSAKPAFERSLDYMELMQAFMK